MAHNPFTPPFVRLPQSLPIFPLADAFLLPNTQLPLNIFETRYLNMVTDALAGRHLIGMIQPDCARDDPADALAEVGCAGQITAYNETDDGRMLIVLQGVCRFRVEQEMPTTRGYRQVVPDWSAFTVDYADEALPKKLRERLVVVLEHYVRSHQMTLASEHLHKIADAPLVDGLATTLPLRQIDKQQLLEIVALSDRAQRLIAILTRDTYQMGPGLQAVH